MKDKITSTTPKGHAVFGRGGVLVQNKSIWSCYLSPLLKYILFRLNNKNALGKDLVYESKEVCIIHVASLQTARNIFNVACSYAKEAEVEGLVHVTCDKATWISNERHVTGHVMDEIWNQIKV